MKLNLASLLFPFYPSCTQAVEPPLSPEMYQCVPTVCVDTHIEAWGRRYWVSCSVSCCLTEPVAMLTTSKPEQSYLSAFALLLPGLALWELMRPYLAFWNMGVWDWTWVLIFAEPSSKSSMFSCLALCKHGPVLQKKKCVYDLCTQLWLTFSYREWEQGTTRPEISKATHFFWVITPMSYY